MSNCCYAFNPSSYDANQPSYGTSTYTGSNSVVLILPDDYEFKGGDEFDSHW